MRFARYAIYHLPGDSDWSRYATRWLGWDCVAGRRVCPPETDNFDLETVTQTPRPYGLHATLKPPFCLTEGKTQEAMERACSALASSLPPLTLSGFKLAALGRFLALVPEPSERVNALAAACVERLDPLRAPLSETELQKRLTPRLTDDQRTNLHRWGYPHVMSAFRYHITLTGRLSAPERRGAERLLSRELLPLLPPTEPLTDIALMGEDEGGFFHLIQRYPLDGQLR